MEYHVICKATCPTCGASKVLNDHEIAADNADAAIEAFKRKHRLCHNCLQSNVESFVTFNASIYVNPPHAQVNS